MSEDFEEKPFCWLCRWADCGDGGTEQIEYENPELTEWDDAPGEVVPLYKKAQPEPTAQDKALLARGWLYDPMDMFSNGYASRKDFG